MADHNNNVVIRIKRQDTPNSRSYWEEFELAWKPGMNVTSSLMDIAANPVTREGKKTTPITYDSNCLEEVCGSCAMLINGRARMACSALVDKLERPIKLEPFSKFPVVRDLSVDRSVLFENLKAVKAWVPVDGTYDLGAGPRMPMEEQEHAYPLSRCISCCCCMEACPQFNESTGFVGAAAFLRAAASFAAARFLSSFSILARTISKSRLLGLAPIPLAVNLEASASSP